jgi:flagellar hook protein FlgE
MLRSLFAGISGLRAHQQMMDVTGNNIANVNTAGFKSSQATFQDTLSQLVKAAGAPQGNNGGTNPAQIGLGVRLGGISTNFTQGAQQTTGRTTDLMIQGDGFFVVQDGGEQLFTRAGSFSFDANGRLVTNGGQVVQGWQADPAGNINTNAGTTGIQLPMGTLLPPTITSKAVFSGNLTAEADPVAPTTITTSIPVYDAQGKASPLSVTFIALAASPSASWDVQVGGTSVGTADFDVNGDLVTTPLSLTATMPAGNTIAVDLSGLTGYSGASTVAPQSQDGSAMGSLQAFTISPDGTLVGVFSNGLKQPIAQLALANFNNPAGLEKVGDSMYRTTVNSGATQLGAAGSGGRGVLQAQTLEMSNVDLAQEFTNLVIAQRGFQANSRVITASDELLQDLVNLKR